MDKFKLIMISAPHENGGNCVHRSFDQFKSLKVYPFESQIATRLSKNIICGPNHTMPQRYAYAEFTSEMSPLEIYHSFWDDELKTYLRTPERSKFKDCGMIMDEKNRIKLFVKYINEESGSLRVRAIKALFRATFDAWENYAGDRNSNVYVGYSPPILFDYEKLKQDFGDNCVMISVTRNLASAYADHKKRPYPMTIEDYCRIYKIYKLYEKFFTDIITLKNSHHSPEFMPQSESKNHYTYGSLIFSLKDFLPENEFKKTFCDEKFDDVIMEPSFNKKPLKSVYPWGTLRTFSPLYDQQMEASLSEEEANLIQKYNDINIC